MTGEHVRYLDYVNLFAWLHPSIIFNVLFIDVELGGTGVQLYCLSSNSIIMSTLL